MFVTTKWTTLLVVGLQLVTVSDCFSPSSLLPALRSGSAAHHRMSPLRMTATGYESQLRTGPRSVDDSMVISANAAVTKAAHLTASDSGLANQILMASFRTIQAQADAARAKQSSLSPEAKETFERISDIESKFQQFLGMPTKDLSTPVEEKTVSEPAETQKKDLESILLTSASMILEKQQEREIATETLRKEKIEETVTKIEEKVVVVDPVLASTAVEVTEVKRVEIGSKLNLDMLSSSPEAMLEASMAAAAWAAPVAVIASEPVAQSSSVVEPEAVALKPELELTDEQKALLLERISTMQDKLAGAIYGSSVARHEQSFYANEEEEEVRAAVSSVADEDKTSVTTTAVLNVEKENTNIDAILAGLRADLKKAETEAGMYADQARLEVEALNRIWQTSSARLDEIAIKATANLDKELSKLSLEWGSAPGQIETAEEVKVEAEELLQEGDEARVEGEAAVSEEAEHASGLSEAARARLLERVEQLKYTTQGLLTELNSE